MAKNLSYEPSFWVSMYVLFGLLLLNCGLYAAYYSTASQWRGEHSDYVFLYRLIDPSFPPSGFALALVSAILGSVLVLISLQKSRGVISRSTLSMLSVVTSIVFSLTFMPFSLTLGFSYLGLAGVVFAVIFMRNTLLEPRRSINLNEVMRKEDKEALREALKTQHSTLISLFRDTIWASITFAVATLSGLLLYQLNSISSGEAPAMYVIFWRWQTLLLLILLLYYLFGFGMGVSLPILRRAQQIEKLLEKV